MSLVEQDGVPSGKLVAEDFDAEGMPKSKEAAVQLVVQVGEQASNWEASQQWNLLWRDAATLYAHPRPMGTWENTGTMEPNVVRYTVAKIINSVVPKIHKGLFYEDPPFLLRPRPGTSQEVIDAKSAVASYLLDQCDFRRQVKYSLEQFALLGTTIVKWGVVRQKQKLCIRRPSEAKVSGAAGTETKVALDAEPNLEEKEITVTRPVFEFRDIREVIVDPKLKIPDIREADNVIDVRFLDYYEALALKDDPDYDMPADLMSLWITPVEQTEPPTPMINVTQTSSLTHRGAEENAFDSPDPLRKKLVVWEYWDKQKCIAILAKKKCIRMTKNDWGVIPFYSANYQNRDRAFYGMGIGLIAGQDQRVEQGTINAVLKMLSLGVNPIYLRSRDSNTPTQMIRTGLGKVLTVDGALDNAYKLLETPRPPAEVWQVLRESQAAVESATGADQLLVQGNTSGGRAGMGRTSGGASIMADASDARLEGPMNNFIEQIYVPWLYQLDEIVKYCIPDSEIMDILGEEMGKTDMVSMADYHRSKVQYEVLAGAHLAVKRAMAQSLVLMVQLLENPNIQSKLAEINGEYIDFKPIIKGMVDVSGWKFVQDVIKPLTPQMQSRMQQSNPQQSKLQAAMALKDKDAQDKSKLEDQKTDNRIYSKLMDRSAQAAMDSEAIEGQPGNRGFGDSM